MGKTKGNRYVLDDDQIKEICKTAVAAGVKAYRREWEQSEAERKNKVLNSSKILVKNYRRFKEMCERSVYNRETTSDDEMKEIAKLMSGKLWNQDVEVLSIKDKVVRTRLIMDHVDTMLEIFEKRCNASRNPEDSRMFRVIKHLYLDEEGWSVEDICDYENITVSTVYRDCGKAFKKLAILFFGIDGVHL